MPVIPRQVSLGGGQACLAGSGPPYFSSRLMACFKLFSATSIISFLILIYFSSSLAYLAIDSLLPDILNSLLASFSLSLLFTKLFLLLLSSLSFIYNLLLRWYCYLNELTALWMVYPASDFACLPSCDVNSENLGRKFLLFVTYSKSPIFSRLLPPRRRLLLKAGTEDLDTESAIGCFVGDYPYWCEY